METWRNIPGYDGDYQISNFGRVRSTDRIRDVAPSKRSHKGYKVFINGKLIRPTSLINKKGKVRRLQIMLRTNGRYITHGVHECVLLAFIGPRPFGYYGCHKDDQPVNNRLANLYWGTPTENCADKIRLGNQQQGSQIPWSKLTEDDVRTIRMNSGIISQDKIATQYGVTQSQISRIINRKEWKHVV